MKTYLESNDINRVVDKLIESTDKQIDSYVSEDNGSDVLEKIRRSAISRVAYKKLRNALLKEMIGDKANEE
jgi:hypothetical protein